MTHRYAVQTLAEVSEVFADGDWVESKDQATAGIRLIQTGNVGLGVFKARDGKARYVSGDTFNRLRCTEIFEGDCLISRLPDPVGRACLIPNTGERMITAVDCTIVRFRRGVVLPAFFGFYSQSADYLEAVGSQTTGATRSRISRSSLGRIPVPVPPIPEQQRLVAVLDEAFEAIATAQANTERNLRNTRDLLEDCRQSVFSQRGSESVDRPFGELIEDYVIGLTRSIRDQGSDKPWPYVKMNNITSDNRFDLSCFTYVNATDEEVRRFALQDGDFLFNTRNSYELVGKSCIYKSDSDRVVLFNNNIARIRFKPGVYPEFVLQAFSSKAVVEALTALKSGTTNVSAIYFKDLRWLPIPLPPIAVQMTNAARLESLSAEIRRLANLHERKLVELNALKQSLLHQAFTGAL
jgi:type I restriction enzyme S subunit